MQVKITLIYNMEEELKAWQFEHCLMIPSDLHVNYYAVKQQVKKRFTKRIVRKWGTFTL